MRLIPVFILALAALPAQAQPSILTSSLPSGAVGTFYQAGLQVSGVVTGHSYSWSSNGAPPGLTVNSGIITGTPTTAGTYSSFVITVTDTTAGNSGSKTFTVTITGPTVTITSSTSLTGATGAVFPSTTFTATGGTAPYTWTIASGSADGLTLSSGGVLSGTPTAAGSFSFTVQAADANNVAGTANVTLTVANGPLQITTTSLTAGLVGVAYSLQLAAGGGTQPYTWTLSAAADGLTLSSNGVLSGTPTAAGTFPITIQVADSASPSATVSKQFSLVVTVPALTILVGAQLPSGKTGAAYNQKFAVTANGGVPPYTWSLNGSVPGLTFDATNVALNGTPTAAGSYSLTLQVADSAGATASKAFTLTIAASLTITTARQLPDGALNSPYSQQLAATGGAPPYAWLASGLPAGVTIGASSGLISGTPTAAGAFFPVVITVQDSALNTYSDNFSLNVSLPPAPPVTITGLQTTSAAATQFPLQIALSSTYSAEITGQAILSFAPDSGTGDGTIQFASGGTTATFDIPAGNTTPVAPTVPLAIQTGTVSGTISVTLRLTAGGVDITPTPAPVISTQIARAAPVITKAQVSRTANALSIAVTGYSTAREVTQATFTFTAAPGQTLQSTASSVSIDVTNLFSGWFSSTGQYGSQFTFTQPFTVTGDPTAVIPGTVTLTNRVGTATANVN